MIVIEEECYIDLNPRVLNSLLSSCRVRALKKASVCEIKNCCKALIGNPVFQIVDHHSLIVFLSTLERCLVLSISCMHIGPALFHQTLNDSKNCAHRLIVNLGHIVKWGCIVVILCIGVSTPFDQIANCMYDVVRGRLPSKSSSSSWIWRRPPKSISSSS